MQENQSSTETKAPIKIYAIGALALVSVVAGVIILNDKTPPPRPATPIEVVEPKVIPVAEIEVESTPAPIAESAKVTEEKTVIPEIVATETVEPEVKPEPEPLPKLDESDTLAIDKAKELSWLPTATKYINNKDLIRNFVTFVDNASRGDLAAKFSPVLSPSAKFSINEIEQEMYIDPKSYERYTPYVDTINSLNVDMAMNALVFMTPLIDEAYMELGYDEGAFVGALNQALAEMLQAPVIRNPIKVVAPSAMYKYADPQLEGLSDIQKLMLRMGPDNITKLRPKLQQIQGALEQLENKIQD